METREFRTSANMIYHLVFSQAGTIAKALAELVMNAHDAGSDTVEITINNDGFKVSDNGQGFRSRQEIENWFEELGFDHSDDLHQQDGRFSRFGLGRAQIMAFAPTVWQTNSFKMQVDIKSDGLAYGLAENEPLVPGCSITGEWYSPLSFVELKTVQREFEELVAYAEISVLLNGQEVNKRNTKWDYDTETVYIRRKETGGLAVYNKGILIRTFPAYQYGSGVVVSKVPFTLNMARNDILVSTCKVWKEVREFLRDEASSRSRKKTRLSEDERQMLIDQLLAGEITLKEVEDSPLIEDVAGRKWKFGKLLRKKITVHTTGSSLAADNVHQSKLAFVLSKKMLEAFEADTAEELYETLKRLYLSDKPHWAHTPFSFVAIEQLIDSNNEYYQIVPDKKHTRVEKAALSALRHGMSSFSGATNAALDRPFNTPMRTLYIGESEHAHAWTDGATFIAIDRKYLRQHARDGMRGFIALANVIVHELCHESNSATGHDHGAEFFQAFHDVLCGRYTNSYGTGIRLSMARFLKIAQKEGLKLNRDELRDLDREVELERDVYTNDEPFIEMVNG